MTKGICSSCGGELPAAAPGGRCPQCLLDFVLELDQEPQSKTSFLEGQRFADYELSEEIARGGMGVVYRARQISLNRIVALKVILSGQFASRDAVRRFHAEAQAAANLRHPNIVAIYETGEENGQHYFSMEFVPGRDLAAMVRNGPLPPKRAARYVELISQAIHYAHQQGTLHRDLKPSNVLIDIDDQPRLTDFGLAKRLDDSSLSRPHSTLTLAGQVLGSPNFMPPEQAAGQHEALGPTSDVYSLGAILYHLLIGRPPFQAETVPATLRLVAESEPVSPRLLQPTLPRDLETICLKCLEKEPAKRYHTAQELADELARFLRDEPIQARPVNRPEQVWRWCRRKPVVASLLAALHLALALGAAGVLWELGARRQALVETRRLLYAADMKAAQQAWQTENREALSKLLEQHRPKPGEKDLRGFEWRLLWRWLQDDDRAVFYPHPGGDVGTVAFASDGRRFATWNSRAKTARVWELGKSIKPEVEFTEIAGVAFSLASSMLALGTTDGTIRLWDAETKREFGRLSGQVDAARVLSFSPDGETLAAAGPGTKVKLWTVSSGQLAAAFDHVGVIQRLAFSADGHVLAASTKNRVRLWETTTGEVKSDLEVPVDDDVASLVFVPSAETLVISGDHSIHFWNLQNGWAGEPLRAYNGCRALALQPRSRTLVSGDWSGAWLWNMDTRQGNPIRRGQKNLISALAFSPDGHRLAKGTAGGVWVEKMRPTVVFGALPCGNQVRSLAFSQDNRLLAVGSKPTLKLWDLNSISEIVVTNAHESYVYGLAFSPDGKLLASGSDDGTASVWDAMALTKVGNFSTSPAWVRVVAFSPDGRILATGQAYLESPGWAVRLWDLKHGKEAAPPLSLQDSTRAMTFSPDGRVLVVTTASGLATLWDTSTWKEIARHAEHQNFGLGSRSFIHGCLFLDGRTLATADNGGRVVLWDTRQRRVVHSWQAHPSGIRAMALSPDGRTLATGGYDREVILWHTATWRAMLTLEHPDTIYALAFSPDGKILATGCEDGITRLWRAAAFAEAGSTRNMESGQLAPPAGPY